MVEVHTNRQMQRAPCSPDGRFVHTEARSGQNLLLPKNVGLCAHPRDRKRNPILQKLLGIFFWGGGAVRILFYLQRQICQRNFELPG